MVVLWSLETSEWDPQAISERNLIQHCTVCQDQDMRDVSNMISQRMSTQTPALNILAGSVNSYVI